MIVLYCAYTVGSSVTYKIARSRATLLSNYPVRIQIILRDREIIRMKSVHSRFREHMARKIRKHALPGDIACCHGPGIKALNCCDSAVVRYPLVGCDACCHRLVVVGQNVLSPMRACGSECVIAYASRSLTRPEQRYCVTRKELLAIVEFVHHFRHYLLGRKFTLRTDHGSLVWLWVNWLTPGVKLHFCSSSRIASL